MAISDRPQVASMASFSANRLARPKSKKPKDWLTAGLDAAVDGRGLPGALVARCCGT